MGYICSNYHPYIQGWRNSKMFILSPSIVSSYPENEITQIPDCFLHSKPRSIGFRPMEWGKVHACLW